MALRFGHSDCPGAVAVLFYDNGKTFAGGMCSCKIGPARSGESSSRIIIKVTIAGIQSTAFVDTGGVYLVCPPEIAELVKLDGVDLLGDETVSIRGVRIAGKLGRVGLSFLPEGVQSCGVNVEVTAFLPEEGEAYPLGSAVLGFTGCLEFMRFAVDPGRNLFFYGADVAGAGD